METMTCEYHQTTDICHLIVELHQAVSVPAQARPDKVVEPTAELPPVPTTEESLWVVVNRIETWGHDMIDPDVPIPDGTDLYFLVLALQTLAGAVREPSPAWGQVASLLRHAASLASAAHHNDSGSDADFSWFIVALYVDRARAVWRQKIGNPLPRR
ncbi:hypothetical protein [Streptomyces sp. NPDC051561]|uniref:hypothetical protein n=1 Tax=Streptomyces sp. NPDC051561 TaxID=3365658 RepID=UPI00379D76AE